MRKKVIKYALMTLLCISFTGCNGKRTLTEEEIRKEIQAKDVFYSQGLEIKEFEIIKRQTDTADREDVIYIHVEGENLDFSVVRNYKLTYLLYNDGWKLETIEPYSDVEYYDETIPLHGLTSEIVESYFEDLKNYNPDTYFSSQLLSVTYGEIEKLESDTYYEIYQQVNIYDYELFQEEIIITISFTLDNFEWVAQTDFSNRPYLKETAMGEWYSDVEVGYAMPDGIYEGGNGVTGYINVSLASESKSDVFL